jgi:hypothetical protein
MNPINWTSQFAFGLSMIIIELTFAICAAAFCLGLLALLWHLAGRDLLKLWKKVGAKVGWQGQGRGWQWISDWAHAQAVGKRAARAAWIQCREDSREWLDVDLQPKARIDRGITCLTCERPRALRNNQNRVWVCEGCGANGSNYEEDKRILEGGHR